MRLKTHASAYALAVALLSSSGALAQQTKAEVMHWWTSAGESAAVRVFADQYTKAGGTWVDTAIAGGVNARAAAINRIVGGNPPTDGAVQHRQAVRRARQQRSPAGRREAGAGRQVARAHAEADRRGGRAQRQVLRRSGQHPRPELDVLQHQGLRGRRRRAAQDLPRAPRGGREAQGQGHHPDRPGRAAHLGAQPVQRRARRPWRRGPVPQGPGRAATRPPRRAPSSRRWSRSTARCGRSSIPAARAGTGTTRPPS